MRFNNASAEVFVPGKTVEIEAINRTTHLAIGAHPDDYEIIAYHGIEYCIDHPENYFSSVTITSGSGGPRFGLYTEIDNLQYVELRKLEQKKAAIIGNYSACFFLDYESSGIKTDRGKDVINDLKRILLESRPRVIYTHSLFDFHETHVCVTLKVISALRDIRDKYIPEKFYGCEAWGSLDWLTQIDKIKLITRTHPDIESAILSIYDSQNMGIKRFDKATIARRMVNTIYNEINTRCDDSDSSTFAVDLLPLILSSNPEEFVSQKIIRFKEEVLNRVRNIQ